MKKQYVLSGLAVLATIGLLQIYSYFYSAKKESRDGYTEMQKRIERECKEDPNPLCHTIRENDYQYAIMHQTTSPTTETAAMAHRRRTEDTQK